MDYTKKIFETATKIIEVIDQSGLPEGKLVMAVIKIVASVYGMRARTDD